VPRRDPGTAVAVSTAVDAVLKLFAIDLPVWEIVLRGTAIYWFLFALFRFVLPREVGAVGVADLLVLVLVADAAGNAMAGGYNTISAGFVLIGTIVGWNALTDWLAWRFPAAARWMQPQPLRLVHHGRMLERNMARQFVTRDELMGKLRAHGVDDLARVKSVFLESSGEVSVVLYDGTSDKPPERRPV
jgi:uncharacterized membrane protein YcaP (DUF421 family)